MNKSISNRKIIFAGWGTENKSDFYAYQMWGYILKKIFPELVFFDTKENYLQFGKDIMNKKLLNLVEKQRPECLIMIFFNDEIYLETLVKIREIIPDIKTGLISCDEDLKYDNFYKFMSLFFDFHLISQKPIISKYKKDNIKNLFFHMDFNTYGLKPLRIKKKYDVTFIGRPKADRAEIIKFLAANNIKITLFGWEWNKYTELKKYYKGFLNAEDYNKVLNQTKINLCFTKAGYKEESGLYNLKGKAFEVALTKSFQLIEYFPAILEIFKVGKEVDTFKTKEELLKKINYYLKHEENRERIADNSYKKVLRDFNREKHLRKLFTLLFTENLPKQTLPNINKRVITLSLKDLKQRAGYIKEKIRDYDYICFIDGECKISPYKEYIQAYSLEKSNLDISCCDYYVYSKTLGNLVLFRGDWAFRRTGKEFYKLLDINQLMTTKKYFLENLYSFKNLSNNNNFNLINKENTIFISIPLISINKLKSISHENMKKAFEVRFMDRLFSLFYQKKLIFNPYFYFLTMKILFGKPFLRKCFLEIIFNRDNWDKLTLNKKYIRNSILKLFTKKF